MQQRQTTTKSDIKEAFIQLLATRNLEDITISQLTKKAGVNRSTFYLHYLDKQDFLEQLKEETITTVRMILRKETFYPKEALEAILSTGLSMGLKKAPNNWPKLYWILQEWSGLRDKVEMDKK